MTLPAQVITRLSSRSAEAENHWAVIDNLHSKIRDIFGDTALPDILDPEEVTFDILRDRLIETSADLRNISRTFETLTTSKESSPNDIMKLLYKLLEARNFRPLPLPVEASWKIIIIFCHLFNVYLKTNNRWLPI